MNPFDVPHTPLSKATVPETSVSVLGAKKVSRMLSGTKTVHAARGKGGSTSSVDYSVHDREGNFFLKPKRVIVQQTEHDMKYTQHGGGMTDKGMATVAGAGGAAVSGAAYAAHKKRRRT